MEISLIRLSKITGCSLACLRSFIKLGEIKMTSEGRVNLFDSSNANFLGFIENVAMKRAMREILDTVKIECTLNA